jgi:hypothetical protein
LNLLSLADLTACRIPKQNLMADQIIAVPNKVNLPHFTKLAALTSVPATCRTPSGRGKSVSFQAAANDWAAIFILVSI